MRTVTTGSLAFPGRLTPLGPGTLPRRKRTTLLCWRIDARVSTALCIKTTMTMSVCQVNRRLLPLDAIDHADANGLASVTGRDRCWLETRAPTADTGAMPGLRTSCVLHAHLP